MNDIQNRKDLEFLLSRFYDSLLQNPEMHHIFIDVAKIDMQEHLPIITDFWEQVLFQTGDYKKNVMKLHVELNEKVQLSPENFQTWLATFQNTVDAHFLGENSEKAKTRALSIATIMQIKLQGF
ncbi:group III truncated hemoglobin [Flavobacterium sp. MAH-1]|uniref:Group III truncated hemoglobin n=1 Tax=Flavobacterium agri TaxID=2743471 RepID=A0A7Y8Y1M7_9FLAO|nr:group III truncated hemoglobin [Flavobacterium agri]NUY80756.1 group III truncated hemoglobin [Flavobacterium agri]NYA70780.1 group III truncated hemoglobin [Flavobacterium agri]